MRRVLMLHCVLVASAYQASLPRRRGDGREHDANLNLKLRFQRSGSPVPANWQPHTARVPGRPSATRQTRKSVARLIEEQTSLDATITYVHPTMVSHYRRYGSRANTPAQSLRKLESHKRAWGSDDCIAHGICSDDQKNAVDKEGKIDWSKIDWSGGADKIDWSGEKSAKEAREQAEDDSNDLSKIDWSGGADKIDWRGKSEEEMTKEKNKKKDPRRTGISRCGFTWDDAAAKMGASCFKDGRCCEA